MRGGSWIVAMGEHEGGKLFVEKDKTESLEEECSIEHGDGQIYGVAAPVKHRWVCFDGTKRHCTLPYTGYRVSVVYFAVPLEKCDASDLAKLYHLGFRVPCTLYARQLPSWPYVVAVCTSRRAKTIADDTLSTLLADESDRVNIHPHPNK